MTKRKPRLIENESGRQSFIINTLAKEGIYSKLDHIQREAFIRAGLSIYKHAHRAGMHGYDSNLKNVLLDKIVALLVDMINSNALGPQEYYRTTFIIDRILELKECK